ncbi:hypothetical protein [Paraburkholderia hospita]|uniref:hypothetical protein n=1 Tax=Paraburkholderia hospita TaxID=169430 RepID=UPI003ECF43BF
MSVKIVVSERAVFARVNRRLDGGSLRTSRSASEMASLGSYFVLDAGGNVSASGVEDLEAWVRAEFPDVLKQFETMQANGGAQ